MKQLNNDGFTVPELITTIVTTGIILTMITGFTLAYWRYTALLEGDLDTYVSRVNAGDILRELIGSSTGLIVQNSIPDENTLVPDESIDGGLFWEPIRAIPGNTALNTSENYIPLIYFKRHSFTAANEFIFDNELPYEDEYILYADTGNRTIRLRSLANPNAPENRLTTSCPPDIASDTCPADRLIADEISSVDLRYFSRTGNEVNYTSIIDLDTGEYIGPDFPAVEVVEIKLNLSRRPLFQKDEAIQNNTIIRVALRN
jgi:hypothetical protein